MKTAFQTGPGFFAADTKGCDASLPRNTLRVYCARLEAYDLDSSKDDLDTQFQVLFAMVEEDPRLAKALLKLGEGIKGNEVALKEAAERA